jgi:RNA polymerase sigma-70 factor (ECF subfamily)
LFKPATNPPPEVPPQAAAPRGSAPPPADAGQFVTLFLRHQRRVYAYLITVLGHAADAEDVLQQTGLILWEKFDQFDPETDFAAWAIRTAYFTAKNHMRKQRRSRVCFSEPMFEAAAQRAAAAGGEADDVQEALGECLKKLPPRDRELIRRRYELDASVKALADQMQRSTHAIYRALRRVHGLLFDCVSSRMAEE